MSERTRTILAANPSHLTPTEHAFWTNFSKAADRAGWHLVQVAARPIPDVPGASTITLPSRLRELARHHADFPGAELARLPFWADAGLVARQTEWEHRRFGIHSFQPGVAEGLKRLAWFVERTVATLRPALVLTTNKIDHPCALFRQAGLAHGARVAVVERSPFDSIWCEPDGLFTESQIWTDLEEWVVSATDPSIRASVVSNPAGFRRSEASAARPNLAHLPRPLVFLPFDNLLWTGWAQPDHPQGTIDNPVYPDPQAALDDLAEIIASHGGSIVLKSHPSCRETPRLDMPPNVHFIDGALDHLIDAADLVAAFNTKVAFVALASGARTLTLAENPVAASGLTIHWRDYDSVSAAVSAGLEASEGPPASAVDEFFTRLAEHHFYSAESVGTRHPGRLLSDLTDGLDALGACEVSAIESVSRLARGDAGALAVRPMPVDRREPPQWRLVLDVSRLVDPWATTSGIARYGRELVRRLVEVTSAEVWAVVREPGRKWSAASSPLFEELARTLSGRVIPVRHSQSMREVTEVLGELEAGDVYHSIHLPLPPMAQTGGATRVITVHDALHLMRPELHPGAGPPTIQRVLDSIVADRDIVVCDSAQTRRDVMQLTDLSGDQLFTVYLGTEVPAGPSRAEREDLIVALLQREPRKNAHNIVQAVAETMLEPENSTLRFAACVSAGAMELVEAALADHALVRDRVDVIHEPTDDMMASLLRRCRAFVFGSSYEGFGLPVLEALAHGCPTVAPINSSLVEVAGSAASFALSEEPRDLAAALGAILADPTYALELSRQARARASLLSWDNSVASLVQVYESARTVEREHRSGHPVLHEGAVG